MGILFEICAVFKYGGIFMRHIWSRFVGFLVSVIYCAGNEASLLAVMIVLFARILPGMADERLEIVLPARGIIAFNTLRKHSLSSPEANSKQTQARTLSLSLTRGLS